MDEAPQQPGETAIVAVVVCHLQTRGTAHHRTDAVTQGAPWASP
jgi:hypothetical protein